MSTDAVYMNSPSTQVPRVSRKLISRTSHMRKLEKQPIRHSSKGSSKSKNEQVSISIPKTQVLPNGEKPDFGNSNYSRKMKNGSQKKGCSEMQQQQGGSPLVDDKTRMLKQQNTKPRSKSDAGFGSKQTCNPVSARPPTVPTSPLERSNAMVASFVTSAGPVSLIPPPLGYSQGVIPCIPHVAPPPVVTQAGTLRPSPFHVPYLGDPGCQYGNYAVSGIPQMNPQIAVSGIGQVCSQMPVPVMQIPQVGRGNNGTSRTIRPPKTSASSRSNSSSVRSTNKGSTSFAGASFASKDPVINKLPKPSFA